MIGEILDGIVGIDESGKAIHAKPDWLIEFEEKCARKPDTIHILLLEELTNASSAMQRKAYAIALDKIVGGKK